MASISTYNISRLSSIFALSGNGKDYLFIDEKKYKPSREDPFRTDTYAIGFLKKGKLKVKAGLSSGIITAPAIITLGPYIIRSIEKVATTPRIELLFFKESFFLADQSNVFYLFKYPFFETSDSHVVPLTKENATKFTIIYDLLKVAIQEGHLHEAALVRSYINVLLCEIDTAAVKNNTGAPSINKTSPLLANFRQLLTKEILQQRSVRFYAGKLNVTPKHLSEIIKKQTGRTAGEWIDQTLILEAKVLLQNKEITIARISDLLNFTDQSVFGKFFKVNAGMSPLAYRNSLP